MQNLQKAKNDCLKNFIKPQKHFNDQSYPLTKAIPKNHNYFSYVKQQNQHYQDITVDKNLPSYVSELLLMKAKYVNNFIVVNNSDCFGIIFNIENQWRLTIVDRFIPVHKQKGEAIYELPIQWLGNLVIKAFSKVLRSYENSQKQLFLLSKFLSYPNYQVFNLQKENKEDILDFLKNTTQTQAKIIIKTRDHIKVEDIGLKKNIVFAEVIGGIWQIGIIKLRTSSVHRWNGNFCIYDKKLKQVWDKVGNFNYAKQFFIRLQDFQKLFTLCMVLYYQPSLQYVVHNIQLQTNSKNASFIQFQNQTQQNISLVVYAPESAKIKILLARFDQQSFQYINSTLCIGLDSLTLNHTLQQGKYRIAVKVIYKHKNSKKFYLTSYSQSKEIKLFEKKLQKNQKCLFYFQVLKNHSQKQGKRFLIDDQKCWITTIDMLKQYDICYMLIFTDIKISYKFVININNQQLKKQKFRLKYPFKSKQNVKLLVEGPKIIIFKPTIKMGRIDFPPNCLNFSRADILQKKLKNIKEQNNQK